MQIKTRISQTPHLGKHSTSAAVIRLVQEMRDRLEELGELGSQDCVAIDNVVYAFLRQLPRQVQDDVREG